MLQSCFSNSAWLTLLFQFVLGDGERDSSCVGVPRNVPAAYLASQAARLTRLSLSFLLGWQFGRCHASLYPCWGPGDHRELEDSMR